MPPGFEPISKHSNATPFSLSALAAATPDEPAPMMQTGRVSGGVLSGMSRPERYSAFKPAFLITRAQRSASARR